MTPHKPKLLSPPWADHGMTTCPNCNMPLAAAAAPAPAPVPIPGSGPGGPYRSGGVVAPSCADGAPCQAPAGMMTAQGFLLCEADCPRCAEIVDEINHDIDENIDHYYVGSFSDGRVGEATKRQVRDLATRVDDLARKLNRP